MEGAETNIVEYLLGVPAVRPSTGYLVRLSRAL